MSASQFETAHTFTAAKLTAGKTAKIKPLGT